MTAGSTAGAERPATVTLRMPTSAPPPCPRCGTPVLLVARYPHCWHNRSGARVDGLRESVLCPGCDSGDPAADGLLALFTGAEAGTETGIDRHGPAVPGEFASRLDAWLTAVRRRVPHEAARAAEAEEARWRAGEL
ncbi:MULTISPECIES: DUF6300 family protein [unclassified Streptomyces]|uniref:DUF6300 family protein n=1 Tax=unclassified Streptomyces TaxID=2593676 RepID=UPI0003A9DB6B|nr:MULTISPECIES: DUF6300 family protein [unclassified Streptomyces]MYT28853.1 hypothetical protein [Streptomyces sp. SID8354]